MKQSQTIHHDYIALRIKLSKFYLYFYITQIVCGITICSLLCIHEFQLISIVQILLAFCIIFDIILNYFGKVDKSCINKVQIVNLIVLMGLITGIIVNVVLPEVVLGGENIVSTILIVGRYIVQAVWIPKLVVQTKKIIETAKLQQIQIQIDLSDIEDQQKFIYN